jgi:hypothetical protein
MMGGGHFKQQKEVLFKEISFACTEGSDFLPALFPDSGKE